MAFSFNQLSQTIYMPAKLKPLANRMLVQTDGSRNTACTKTAAEAMADIAPKTRTWPTRAKTWGIMIEPEKIPAK